MLTRRGFAGFASCAICGIAEFIASDASADSAPPATTPGVTRKILSQMDGPTPGYVTLLVEATIEASYVLEGGLDLPIEGQPIRPVKAGDFFQIPPGTPHAGGKPPEARSRILTTFVVEKGKPLASPA